ncbi:MAG: hypothetical protein K0R48_773 [Gammaproteobacteria bacterium]|jgi:hypothetical protein|nr:hypothetical protein [Gammaproteobacteria bacterium]
MTNSFDRSHKDKQYFINGSAYNCPFCGRRHVSYSVSNTGSFDVSNTKTVYYYWVCCDDDDCGKTSFHLSKYDLVIHQRGAEYGGGHKFAFPPQERKNVQSSDTRTSKYTPRVSILDKKGNPKELDDIFFYHQPSAFFTIDDRIPSSIREPLSQACDCLKSNFLTGASACLRKSIYKFLQEQNIPEKNESGFIKSDERIETLKKQQPQIKDTLFNKLKSIHTLTSQELHENDWEDFDAHTLRFLLEITRRILTEIYVFPDEERKENEKLSELENKAKIA